MKRLTDRVPVEPMGDAQWDRVERRLFEARERERVVPRAEPPGRSWRMVALAATLGAAVAAAGVLLVLQSHGKSVAGARAVLPAKVVTPAGAGTRLELGDAVVEVGPGSVLEVQPGPAGAITIALAHGRVACDVTPRPGRPPFMVAAGDVLVTVLGTEFSVDRAATVTVAVTRGKVRVESPSGKVALLPGDRFSRAQAASADAASAAGAASAGAGSAAASLGVAAGGGGAGNRGQATGDRQQGMDGGGGSPSASLGDNRGQGTGNGDLKMAGGGGSPSASLGKGSASRKTDIAWAKTGSAKKAGPETRLGKLEAARLMVPTDPDGAEERFVALATGTDEVAARALYQLAHLALFHTHKPAHAIELSQEYEARFPHGHDAADALWVRIEAYVSANDRNAARATARAYLTRYPGHDKAGRAEEIANR